MTVQLSLNVNDTPIKTDYFVEGFIDHTVSGMVEALEGTGPVRDLEMSISGKSVAIKLNGSDVPINEFVVKIIRSTMNGLVSVLKGVSGEVKTLKLTINK
jgi:hypothetical protein